LHKASFPSTCAGGSVEEAPDPMLFHATPLSGAYLIELEKRTDDRGFFARYFCEQEFEAKGLETRFVQINNSFTAKEATVRGFHYQLPPAGEVKVVRCVRGSLWDVLVDLRPDSPTFMRWYGAELSADNRLMMYVPRGFAHAFLTLSDNTEAIYLVSAFYAPEQERGLRWDDPSLHVDWPIDPIDVSPKDASWPNFDPVFHGIDLLRGLE
jgi:dTDP-4-dehydrorhamnose 3,5-epimerase